MIKTIIDSARARLGIPASVPCERYNSVLDLLDEAVARFPQQAAFTSLGHTLTLQDLDRLSKKFAAELDAERFAARELVGEFLLAVDRDGAALEDF